MLKTPQKGIMYTTSEVELTSTFIFTNIEFFFIDKVMLKKMDIEKQQGFWQLKKFLDEFTNALIFIDIFHYFSLFSFNDGGKLFSIIIVKLVI